MRRVLMITPHFPPDATAGAHRVRLLAPYLQQYGWEPTVLTCEVEAYEGQIDPGLLSMVPSSLRVVRAPALPVTLTRRAGVGDLGLRAFRGLYKQAVALLESERFDAVFVTIFPAYPALLGPLLVRRFGLPFVLDYQDPWVNAWGDSVGGGKGGRVDMKSRAVRWLAETLEPYAVRAATAITAVSEGTYEPILARNPASRPITAAIPLGAEPRDFADHSADSPTPLPVDFSDGRVHVCYTGTVLPLGFETLRAVLEGARRVRDTRPELYDRLRLHFIGSSNQVTDTREERVMPIARELGVDPIVSEIPRRVPYSSVVRIQKQAAALLALGSTEHHYTASKIFPLLLARRPLLAMYHERSTVVDVLRNVARPPSVRLLTFSDTERANACVAGVAQWLTDIVVNPVWRESDVNASALREFSAERLAGRLATVFDQAIQQRAAA